MKSRKVVVILRIVEDVLFWSLFHLKSFEVLSDDQKRAQYDQFGADPFQRRQTAGGTSYNTSGWQYQATIDPEELFRKMFGKKYLHMDEIYVVISIWHQVIFQF